MHMSYQSKLGGAANSRESNIVITNTKLFNNSAISSATVCYMINTILISYYLCFFEVFVKTVSYNFFTFTTTIIQLF